MILNTSSTIRAVLGEAISTVQPEFLALYADITASAFTPGAQSGAMNGATQVTVVSSPASDTRTVKQLSICNNDDIDHTITVVFHDGTNERTLVDAISVSAGSTLTWTLHGGWFVQPYPENLTPEELAQLQNIDSVTISNTQWGHVGALDQGVATTDDVTFDALDNTPIGGTTPAAGGFTTLTASGDVTLDTSTLFVDSSTNRVGVGTLAPTQKLHVAGDAHFALPGAGIGLGRAAPSDYWGSGQNTGLHLPYGVLGSTGSFGWDVTANGYRNSSAGWTSLGINGSTAGTMLRVSTQGYIGFHAEDPVSSVLPVERARMHVDGGWVFGSPTGGNKGPGTLNAQAVYDDNTLLTCYVFDQAMDGTLDVEKWDAKTPDRVRPAVRTTEIRETGETGENGDPVMEEVEVLVEPEKIEPRRHEPLRKFAARIGTPHDPLTLDGYAAHWQEKRHLSSMPNEANYDPVNGAMTTGEWIQRLVETVEIQAVLIEQLNQRVKALEARIAALEG